MALCKLYTRYTVGQEGEISTNFFHNKLAGFGPGNCYLTFRAANHLNTSEHVLLKDYKTGFIAFVFASQFKKKKFRMSHLLTETQCVTIFYTFIIFYTTFSRSQKSVYQPIDTLAKGQLQRYPLLAVTTLAMKFKLLFEQSVIF